MRFHAGSIAERIKNLRDIIVNSTTNTNVVIKTNDIIVQIADIDAVININALKQEIKQNYLKLRDKDLKILSMRPTMGIKQRLYL